MHELSIATAIVQIAERHAAGRRVTRVEVRVGHLRQVVPSALEFAFELITQGTALDGAELALEEVPVVVRCGACAAHTDQEAFPFACGACGGWDVEVVQGEELLVDAIDLEELVTSTGGTGYGSQ
jgi:hydrogenase nickel incorporation protein HypA/HybF